MKENRRKMALLAIDLGIGLAFNFRQFLRDELPEIEAMVRLLGVHVFILHLCTDFSQRGSGSQTVIIRPLPRDNRIIIAPASRPDRFPPPMVHASFASRS